LEIQLDKTLKSNLVDDDIQIEKITRKINFGIRAMQTALKKQRDSLGKETKPHHYINELRLIRFTMTGDSKQAYDLSNPPREHLSTLRRVICMSRRLIGMHVPLAQRKQACRDFVLKKLTETSK
jgi:hypothetical protein